MGWNYLPIVKLQRLYRWSLGKDKQFHPTLYNGCNYLSMLGLTHWGRVTHICVSKLTIIGSDNGLSPDRRQAIIWTNAGLLLIGPLGTNFGEIPIEILTFSLKKMRLKVSSAKRWPFCLGLNVLKLNHVSKRGPRSLPIGEHSRAIWLPENRYQTLAVLR